jgi:hypothetical protein
MLHIPTTAHIVQVCHVTCAFGPIHAHLFGMLCIKGCGRYNFLQQEGSLSAQGWCIIHLYVK